MSLRFGLDPNNGCCACEDFFEELEAGWESVENVEIPQFDGLHDYLSVYQRKER